MINFIVELDDTKEPKELVDYLKKHHRTMRFCKECAFNIEGACQMYKTVVLDNDFCSASFPKIKDLYPHK